MEAVAWARDGDVEKLREWLSKVDIKESVDDEDQDAAIRRQEVFSGGFLPGGMSLLHWATDSGRVPVITLLLSKYPGLLNTVDSEGSTPLHYAALNGHAGALVALFEHGAEIKLDFQGESPLHVAALNGHDECARDLLKRGADVNLKSNSGFTPLHLAAVNRHHKMIGLLLSDSNVNPNIKDSQGMTARDIAETAGDSTLMDYFESGKRENLVQISKLELELELERATVARLAKEHEETERLLMSAYRRLKEEEDNHKAAKLKLSELEEQIRGRTLSEQEERYSILYRRYEDEVRKRVELEAALKAFHIDDQKERNIVDTRVQDAHRSLSNLFSAFHTLELAIVSAKNDLEAVKPLMHYPATPQEIPPQTDSSMEDIVSPGSRFDRGGSWIIQ